MDMKKYLFVSAIAALALSSCSSDYFTGDVPGNTPSVIKPKEISFGSETGKISRADAQANNDKTDAEAAAALGNNFIVYGEKTKDEETSIVYNYYNVNWKNTGENSQGAWVYAGEAKNTLNNKGENQTIKYWDYSATKYDFTAFSLGGKEPGDGENNIKVSRTEDQTTGSPTYTFTGKVVDLQSCYIADRITVENNEGNKTFGQPVKFTFHSAGSKVCLGIYETIPGYSIKDIKFYDELDTEDNYQPRYRPVLIAKSACIPVNDSKGTLTVTFDNANKAKTVLNKTQETEDTYESYFIFDQKSYKLEETKEYNESENTTDRYLGRSRERATKTNPRTISPCQISGGLTLKIDYTLISTDGSGEEITVKGATATIPEKYTKWEANYIYTYYFNITDKTNGSTGGSETGLSPIVFDAVVTEDINGSQTTETTFDKDGSENTKDITNDSQTTK